jgi:hypothetical protein
VDFVSNNFNVNNKFIITQELCDFETDISLSNYNIKDVGTISPCTQINVGNLTLQGNTINNSTGTNLLINNVQKINNKSLPNGDFFGTADQLTLSQIPNALITKEKIADAAVTLPKIAAISANSLLGNNTGSLATPMILGVSDAKTMLSLNNVENTTLSTWPGSTNLTVFGNPSTFSAGGLTLNYNTLSSTTTNSNIILTPNGTGVVSLSANLNMNSKNITSLGTINGLSLPSTNFVGLSDFQTITNKTIDAIQLTDSSIVSSKFANGSLTLAKMQTIPTNTILGNNTASSSIPLTLTANEVKTMLGITTSTITLSGDVTGTGSSSISTTIADGAITNTKLGVKSVSLDKIANISANTILGSNIAGNNSPTALSVSDVKTMLSLNNVENVALSSFAPYSLNAGGFNLNSGILSSTVTNNNITLTPNGTGVVSVSSNLNMNTKNITSVGNINGLTLPSTSIVGIADFQTLTNKSIDAIQLSVGTIVSSRFANGALTMNKMENLPMMTFMGNSSDLTATYPEAMSVSTVKSLLGLSGTNSGDQIITLTGDVTGTGTGSFAATIGSGAVSLSKMANLAANSIIGNNTASSATPLALSASQVKTVLSLNNVENTALSTWVGSSNITTIANNSVSLSNMAALAANSIIGNNTSSSTTPIALSASQVKTLLSLNNVENTALSTWAGSTNITSAGNITLSGGSGVTELSLDGTISSNTRAILYKNSGIKRMELGLTSAYFFLYDSITGKNNIKYVLGGGANPLKFENYTNGSLSIINSDGTLSSSSDRRLKQNEEELNSVDSLQKIMNLEPKKYTWKTDKDNRTQIGFIAQDVESVIPDAVDGKKFEYEFIRDNASQGVEGTIRVDEDGMPVLDYTQPRYRGLNQCAILSTLVSAFQELVQKNNLLESRITELEGLVVYENA